MTLLSCNGPGIATGSLITTKPRVTGEGVVNLPRAASLEAALPAWLCWPLKLMCRRLTVGGTAYPLAVASRSKPIRIITYLISQVELCGMSMANEPAGSPAGVGFEMQANASRPVIPLYLPVPPVIV